MLERIICEINNLFANPEKDYYFSMGLMPKDIQKVLENLGYKLIVNAYVSSKKLVVLTFQKNNEMIEIFVDIDSLTVKGNYNGSF